MRKAILTIFGCLIFPLAGHTHIEMTEIMYDPLGSDDGREWIEFRNSGVDSVFTDSNWRIFDGSNHTITFATSTVEIQPKAYFVVADSVTNFLSEYPGFTSLLAEASLSLNNSGEQVGLRASSTAAFLDQLTYDAAWGGAENGSSLEKTNEGWRSSYIKGGTPGLPNSTSSSDASDDTDYRGKVVINEILADPVGSDSEGEWIELYNRSTETINVTGWVLSDPTRNYTLPTLSLESTAYAVISRTASGIALNNTSDTLALRDGSQNLIDEMSYEDTREGFAVARRDDVFELTRLATPGSENVFPQNQPPSVAAALSATSIKEKGSIVFDASLSSDPENDELTFDWDFGDGTTSNRQKVSHRFELSGSYTVILTVSDSEGARSSSVFTITVGSADTEETISEVMNEEGMQLPSFSETIDGIRLNEFLPNPTGSDDNEWIELYNDADEPRTIAGWKLDDAEGGSRPFVFPPGTTLGAKSFQVWSRMATKIALNNNNDSVRLLSPNDEVFQEVVYSGAKEGWSYQVQGEDLEWVWLEAVSQGAHNIFVLGIENENIFVATSTIEYETNSLAGLVIVPPHHWYKQKFYIADPEYQSDVLREVYQYRGEFPEVQQGDIVLLSDYVESEVNNGIRYKISVPDQIQVIDSIELENPPEWDISEIDDDLVQKYIQVRGLLQKINKASLRIQNDIGDELVVYLGSDWEWGASEPVVGRAVLVRGIVTKSGGTFRIRPILVNDISLEQIVTDVSSMTTSTSPAEIEKLEISTNAGPTKTAMYILSPAVLGIAAWWAFKRFV